jgi:hypothetical protein
MVIGAVVAIVGALGAFVLVRQRDFIVPTGPPAGGQPGGGAGTGARGGDSDPGPGDAIPAVHA